MQVGIVVSCAVAAGSDGVVAGQAFRLALAHNSIVLVFGVFSASSGTVGVRYALVGFHIKVVPFSAVTSGVVTVLARQSTVGVANAEAFAVLVGGKPWTFNGATVFGYALAGFVLVETWVTVAGTEWYVLADKSLVLVADTDFSGLSRDLVGFARFLASVTRYALTGLVKVVSFIAEATMPGRIRAA